MAASASEGVHARCTTQAGLGARPPGAPTLAQLELVGGLAAQAAGAAGARVEVRRRAPPAAAAAAAAGALGRAGQVRLPVGPVVACRAAAPHVLREVACPNGGLWSR